MAKTFLTSIDLNGNQLLSSVLENTATIPTLNLKKGRVAFDTANNKTIVYDGSIWKNLEWELAAGTTSQYYRGDKTWQTLNTTAVTEGTNLYFNEVRVRGSVLTGYVSGSNVAIASTDTILAAFGKIQGQLNAKQTLDADLTAIAGLAGTSGFLKKTAADTWTLDTSTYLLSTATATAASKLATSQDFSITGGATASAITFNGTGAVALNVTSLDASKLSTSTTIPSAVLGRSTLYIGTTAVALNRASSALALTGITSIAIGNAVLKYDSTNNALYVEKTDGTAVNFYSTGENSAYGVGSGTGGGSGVSALSALNVLIYNGTHWENKPQSALVPDLTPYAQKTYVDSAIADLVASSPAALDTLNELAAALGDDANFSQTVATQIGTKVTANTAITAGTATKITYDAKGLVTAGASLTATDIPSLDTSKLTSGVLSVARGGTGKASWTVGAIWASAATTLTSGTLPILYGGTGATTVAGALTALGATVTGSNLFKLGDTATVGYLRINADNTVSYLDAAQFRSAIGAGTSSTIGTVTSVSGTGSVNGITLTGSFTTSGSLTLGGTLSNVSLTSQVTGTLPTSNGGTGLTDAKGGFTRKLTGTFTTSATSYAITHNLNSDVVAQVIDTGTLEVVECDVVLTTANVATFNFNVAPTASKYRYIIIG